MSTPISCLLYRHFVMRILAGLQLTAGAVVVWLVRWTTDRVVRVGTDRGTVLCSWATHFTLS